MTTAAVQLAEFASRLSLQAIPPLVQARALACVADAVGCAIYGAQWPWSRQVADLARRYGSGGTCEVWGSGGAKVQAPQAALANAAAIHAFEQDSLRFPGAGVHPGAALVPAIAAACQETGADGATALRAFVAGCEVLFRIGAATHHSSEKLGFHAPGLTGTYGATVAAGVVYGLSASDLAGALGLAGSMSAGLLAFSKAPSGAAVKRLHMGRACEAGIVAARLAQSGFHGPDTILEGRFGFLEVYAREGDASLLTRGLGRDWETLKICLKRYACHVTAQAPMQALRELMAEQEFQPQDVMGLSLQCAPKVCSHHDIRKPGDLMQAQYSVPFCVALALHRDPLQPSAFDESALTDPDLAQTCALIDLQPASDLPTAWSARLTVTLRDGRRLERAADAFRGMPQDPAGPDQERERFLALCQRLGRPASLALHERLAALPVQPCFPSTLA
jgi:2-methylcitrate dehydratase PrpD